MNNARIARELLRIAEEVRVIDLPDTRQTYPYDCGAKASQTILAYYGHDVREDKILKFLGTTEDGTNVKNIVKLFKRFGLHTIEGQLTVEGLREAIDKGWPVLMPIQAWVDDLLGVDWSTAKDEGHYVVAIGYREGDIIFEDPAAFKKQYLPVDELEQRWHDFDSEGGKYDHYGIIVKGDPEYSSTQVEHME
jgi:ABC-type bacteriocin/lantibiotic exporter with double-glycine peptidase domain